ncbi:MAG: TldD/PmbA family protein [Nanoarchaeota archaeon]|nr:TldD/PmbA family protein [Nanoarchaeota archaeon]
MFKDLADFAVKYALKLGADYSEARLEETASNSFILKNGIAEASGFGKINGLGMRIIKNKTLGFASTNHLDKEKIKKLIQNTINTTEKASHLREEINLSEEKSNKDKYKIKQKINLNDIGPEEKIKLLFDAEKELINTKIKIPSRYISLSDSITTEYLVNSDGTNILATVPRVSFFYLLTVEHNNKTSQRIWQYGQTGGFEFVKKWDIPSIVVNEVKALQKNLKFGIKPPKQALDIIAAPQIVGIMVHESGGHPYEADRIIGREGAQAGESFITKEMLGTRIGNEVVNVVDDPTIENSYGFYKYDNEGVKARRKYLINKGLINEFLHNRETAYYMGIKSNGSSRSVNYDRESIVRMSNTFMLPGKYSEEELIEDIKLGIYMKNFMEWNIDDKRINQKYVGAESYLIKNGEIKEPVIRPVIEITTPQLYSAVDAVANNTEYHAGNCGKGEPMQPIPVWFGGPSIRLRKIRLGN